MKQIISSYKTTIILLIIYALLLAIATIIEKYYGTQFTKTYIYYSPVLILLQFLLVINFITVVIRKNTLKKRSIGFILLHFSFIIILFGALISYIYGEEGILHIREGEKSNKMIIHKGDKTVYETLPFSLGLTKFVLKRYPGSSRASSFESQLIVYTEENEYPQNISMNNVLDIKGYRIFQTSYDKDEKGTILTINKDVAGRNITYTGYLFLFIGFALCLVAKNSRLRYLSRKIKEIQSCSVLLLLVVGSTVLPCSLSANNKTHRHDIIKEKVISSQHAAQFGSLPMLANNGRIEPINTFSSKLLRKLHKSEKIEGLNSDQFLLSVFTFPDFWMHIPFIHLSNPDIALYYDLTIGNCAYIEAFDEEGKYKFTQKLEEALHKMPSKRTVFEKDLLKLDEQMNIFHQLLNLKMLTIFPKKNDPDHKWYAPGDDLSVFSGSDSLFVSSIMPWYIEEIKHSVEMNDWSKSDELLNMIFTYQQKMNNTVEINNTKIEAELIYNKLNIFKYCKKGYLIFGGLLLLLSFISFFKSKNVIKILSYTVTGIICLYFLCHLSGIGIRGYISGYAPWSNSYETMVFASWVTILAGLFFLRKSMLIFALATLFGGVILFVSGLNWMDPQIDLLVPVLKSPWLMFHVATIIAAYGFFGISCLIGLTNIILMLINNSKDKTSVILHIRKTTFINEMSMIIGLALMTIGTFLGAIWANESWGRYWGWDPKETWALITILIYTLSIHLRLVKRWDNYWLFNVMSVASFYSVLMTYFGVNYFLSGMHSYGQIDSAGNIFLYIFGSILFITGLSIFSCKKIYTSNK